MRTELWRALRRRPLALGTALAVALLVANVIAVPQFAAGSQIAPTLGTLAPFVLVGMASTPAVLSGGGGIDLSIAPLMGFIGIVLVTQLLGTPFGSPALAVPLLLMLGAAIGAINGLLIARARFPPVIATLAMYFVLAGVNLRLAPEPVTTENPWTESLAGSIGPVPGAVLTIGAPLVLWWALRRSAYVESLLAVGDHDATAFSAGVNVDVVRISAYALGGLIAAVGGIALTGLVRSADADVFDGFVLPALAAVALGGTNLVGGRGGLGASAIGASCIFLLDNLLAALNVATQYVQVAYGGALLFAVVFGTIAFNPRKARLA